MFNKSATQKMIVDIEIIFAFLFARIPVDHSHDLNLQKESTKASEPQVSSEV